MWIHFGENFIDIWGGADFGPYSSQSFNLSIASKKVWHQSSILWWPGRPKCKSGGQRDHQLNWGWRLEILDNFPSEREKYWTWRLIKSLKEYLFLLVYLVSLATNFVLLWPLEFEFGHQIFEVGGQLPTKIKIPLWGLWHAFVTYTWGRIYLISNIKILSFFRSTLSIDPQRKVNLTIMAPLHWPCRVSRRNSCGQRG